MLPGRNSAPQHTKSLTWWANDKPEIEDLLRSLLDRRGVRPMTLSKKKSKDPIYIVAISHYEHGNAEDFHFGHYNTKAKKLRYELDLTRISAHGRKQRLNCAMEEARDATFEDLDENERLVLVKPEEYEALNEIVITKMHP